MKKFRRHKRGHVNPIFLEEEISLFATIDKALKSSANPQILGRNGEKPLLDFLNRHLPNCFRAVSGHFITPDGKRSPQIDIMIVDSRYPYLSQNIDESVLVMLHSLICTIEIKTTIRKRDIQSMCINSRKITELSSEVFSCVGKFDEVSQKAICYRAVNRLDTIVCNFFDDKLPDHAHLLLFVLRLQKPDQSTSDGHIGVFMWYERGKDPFTVKTLSPLSDFYFSLVQDSYYTIGSRDFTHRDIGGHINSYMTWGVFYEK